MLISQEYKKIIEEWFRQVKLGEDKESRLYQIFKKATEDEQICLKYLYVFMPDQDSATYEPELFLEFVKQALEVSELTSWGKNISTEIFLNYVLQYRINNENIEYYRRQFFEQIFAKIKNLTMYEAAIEVNYWCFEKATYQSTDIRTASPLTVLKNTYGRCGEESTLTVAALRSVGIPARQVYTPRWAHCDDNHAWVEVWIAGKWHCLGACEPEPLLDTGWFMLPASKAMLIHNKVFSTLIGDEKITTQSKDATEINLLSHYAQTKEVTVRVKNNQGDSIEGAMVRFEIINYSELFPIAEIKTNQQGEVQFSTGLGDLIVYVYKDGKIAWKRVDIRLEDKIEITLQNDKIEYVGVDEIILVPPVGGIEQREALTDSEKKRHEEKISKALKTRETFKALFYLGERAKIWAKAYKPYEKEVVEALEKSLGNYQEIMNFIQDPETSRYLKYKMNLLGVLVKKDLTDITCEILKEHLLEAVKYKNDYEEDVFIPYILSPRVHFEMIRIYRKSVLAHFTEDKIQLFRENPKKIYEFSMSEIETIPESGYSTLYTSITGLLEVRRGNMISKKVLFVALCRSLGIPAKLDREDDTVSYYQNREWVNLKEDKVEVIKTSQLILRKENQIVDFDYFKNYTIGKLEKGVYITLNLENTSSWQEGSISYKVEAGRYRVITTNRQVDGSILARLYYIEVAENIMTELMIGIIEEEKEVRDIEIIDIKVEELGGESCYLSTLVQAKYNIVAYLDVGAEPTEHLLNEIIESKDKYNTLKPPTIFIINKDKDIQNITLQKALLAVPHIKVYIGMSKEYLDTMYDKFDMKDKKLPLVYIVNKNMKGQYAWAGYNVGIVEIVLKYIRTK